MGGLQKISHGFHTWYGVQNMSKYDIDIKEQPLILNLKVIPNHVVIVQFMLEISVNYFNVI